LPDSDYDFLAGLSANPNRPGDTSNFNPAFARNLAAAIREAKANGLNVGVESGLSQPARAFEARQPQRQFRRGGQFASQLWARGRRQRHRPAGQRHREAMGFDRRQKRPL
jgi:hypothetical protein